MMENPIVVGFLIFCGWFAIMWGLSAFLTECCGMVEKHAYPSATVVATIPAALLGLVLYGGNVACWIIGGAVFTIICIWISGGMG